MNYADETKIHNSDSNPQVFEGDINRDLANTLRWFKQNGMKANPEKYQALVLGNTNRCISIKYEDNLIPISEQIKLLGVTLDSKLQFHVHVSDICRRVGGKVT